jgi:AcrR family transcriptional regulator
MPKAKPVVAADPEQTWARPAYQTRSREQRDRLLKAGERAFAAQGYWQTHVTDITRRAGCSVGSFYRRFQDKEAFFMALQADMAARAETNIARFFDDPAREAESLEQLFTKLAGNTARTMRRIEGYYRALFELSLRGGHDVWPPMRRLESLQADHVLRLMADRGLVLGEGAHDRAQLAIRVMSGHLAAALLHGPGPWRAEDPDLHAEMGRLIVRYLGAEAATSEGP